MIDSESRLFCHKNQQCSIIAMSNPKSLSESILMINDFNKGLAVQNPGMSRVALGTASQQEFYAVHECEEYKYLNQSMLNIGQLLDNVANDVAFL
jgi:hypothetical protein